MCISSYRHFYHPRFWAVLILLCWCETTIGQAFTIQNQRKRQVTSFKLINNLVIIPVYINSTGPYNFILDTGVGILLISDPDLLKLFDTTTSRAIKIQGIGEGAEMTALIQPSVQIELASSIRGIMPVAILKEDPFNLSSFVGMPIHGLIGYELFSSFIIRINHSSKVITYYRHETAYIPRKGQKVSISIEDRKPYLESTLKLPDGKREKVKLIIDTGAGHPLSLETSNGIPYSIPEVNIPANLGVGLSGMINGYISRIPAMTLGRYQLHDVVCAFPDYSNVAAKVYSVSRNGSLGNSVLKRFNVVFDYQREVMYLKPNYLFKEPFEHDMSGIEITAVGPAFERVIIARVEAGSAAEQAGLKEGDRILSVNFKKVEELGIEELKGLFRSKDGRSVVLHVQPYKSENSQFVFLTLKKRI